MNYLIQKVASTAVLTLSADAVRRVANWTVVTGHAVASKIVAGLWIRRVHAGRAVLARFVLARDQTEALAQFPGELVWALAPEQAW